MLHGSSQSILRELFNRDAQSRNLPTQWTTLPPVWAGGLAERPRIALVFINPTYRNQSTVGQWTADRAPFIGLARIWRFLASCDLLDQRLVRRLPPDGSWTEEDAYGLYEAVAESSLYVTNLVKACGIASELPPPALARDYLDLLRDELKIVSPAIIVPMGVLVTSLLLKRPFRLGDIDEHLAREGRPMAAGKFSNALIVPSYFPIGRGNPTKARAILSKLELPGLPRAGSLVSV
jgi:hypothetical protein